MAHAKRRLGRDQNLVAFSCHRFSQYRLRQSIGVDVSRIEKIDARIQADVDEASGFSNIARSPGLEEICAAAKRARAKTQHRNFETGLAKLSEFHTAIDYMSLINDSEPRLRVSACRRTSPIVDTLSAASIDPAKALRTE